MAIRTMRDVSTGHLVSYEVPEFAPMSPEQSAALKDAILALAKQMKQTPEERKQAEVERLNELERKREERLLREELLSLSEQEQQQFAARYGRTATARRLAEAARREVDEHWQRQENERQQQALVEWRKSRSKVKVRNQQGQEWEQDAPISSRDEVNKMQELMTEGDARAKARLDARVRRELEAEVYDDNYHRIYNSLDADEQAVFNRMLSEQPTLLERVRQFKAEVRNAIADVNDSKTLYRLAMQRQRQQPFVEPLSNVENVNSSRMLYRMAAKQIVDAQEAKKQKKAVDTLQSIEGQGE